MEDLDWLDEERKNKRGEVEEPVNVQKKKKETEKQFKVKERHLSNFFWTF